MKTIVLNTFSSFATFPMFNPAYIKGLLCREGIDNIHIDVNQITWNSCKRLRVYTLHNSKKAVTAD